MSENFDVDNNEENTSIALVVLLEEVIELINEAKSVPFTSNIIVNRHSITELLKQAIDAVPEDVVTADRVVSEAEAVIEDANVQSEQIVENARVQADDIIAQAHERAKVLVSSERVIRLASENADKIVAKAEENSRNLALGADSYCDERLNELEELLEVINRQVVAGREAIAARSGFDPELEKIDVEKITEENYSYDN